MNIIPSSKLSDFRVQPCHSWGVGRWVSARSAWPQEQLFLSEERAKERALDSRCFEDLKAKDRSFNIRKQESTNPNRSTSWIYSIWWLYIVHIDIDWYCACDMYNFRNNWLIETWMCWQLKKRGSRYICLTVFFFKHSQWFIILYHVMTILKTKKHVPIN